MENIHFNKSIEKFDEYAKIITSGYFEDILNQRHENGKINSLYYNDRIHEFEKYYFGYMQ